MSIPTLDSEGQQTLEHTGDEQTAPRLRACPCHRPRAYRQQAVQVTELPAAGGPQHRRHDQGAGCEWRGDRFRGQPRLLQPRHHPTARDGRQALKAAVLESRRRKISRLRRDWASGGACGGLSKRMICRSPFMNLPRKATRRLPSTSSAACASNLLVDCMRLSPPLRLSSVASAVMRRGAPRPSGSTRSSVPMPQCGSPVSARL